MILFFRLEYNHCRVFLHFGIVSDFVMEEEKRREGGGGYSPYAVTGLKPGFLYSQRF